MAQRVTLPLIAERLRAWFPELDGRAFAVSNEDITSTNAPGLPLAMVALNNITTDGVTNIASVSDIDMIEDIGIEFWFAPEKIDLKTGAASPFWKYRDYNGIMDRLISGFLNDDDIQESRDVEFVSMDLGTTDYAVIFAFRFRLRGTWCEPENCDINVGEPISVVSRILPGDSCGCDGDCDGEKNCGSDCP